jgi:hypothetical protein
MGDGVAKMETPAFMPGRTSIRGLPHLRKLREIMDHIYALLDRRCRMQTALEKLKRLRQ